MRRHLLHQPMFRLAVPPVYGFMMYFLILLVMNSLYQIAETMLTQELLLCVLLAYLISESSRLATVFYERGLDRNLKKPLDILAIFLINGLVGSGLVYLAVYMYFIEYLDRTTIDTFRPELITLVTTYGISTFMYTLFYLSIHFLTSKNETEIRQEDLKRQNLEHQLEIFNNEINPDLLFQSLETLISLVHHNLDSAEDFVDRLSLTYRYILENRKRELVSLSEEIRASKNLFYLFQQKYPGQISLDVNDFNDQADRLLVPNSMPILLDYIINGSIISQRQPLKVSMEYDEQEDYLVIKHKDNDRLSIQHEIVKRQERLHEAYAYFTDRPVIQIKAYGDVFTKLPLLNINGA